MADVRTGTDSRGWERDFGDRPPARSKPDDAVRGAMPRRADGRIDEMMRFLGEGLLAHAPAEERRALSRPRTR